MGSVPRLLQITIHHGIIKREDLVLTYPTDDFSHDSNIYPLMSIIKLIRATAMVGI